MWHTRPHTFLENPLKSVDGGEKKKDNLSHVYQKKGRKMGEQGLRDAGKGRNLGITLRHATNVSGGWVHSRERSPN
jgi:hypothetical protein